MLRTDAVDAVTLVFYGPNEEMPALADVHDRVGTIDANGAYWNIGGKGQSGRSGTGEAGPDIVATVPTEPIVSMQRTYETKSALLATEDVLIVFTDKVAADGQSASGWAQSSPPGLNFQLDAVGVRTANPGTTSFTFADPVVEETRSLWCQLRKPMIS